MGAMRYLLLSSLLLLTTIICTQGTIEAEIIKADSLKGNGSKITGIQLDVQNLSVSQAGDTLHISEGNWVLIPGISSANSGNAFANAGADILNACVTIFNLSAQALSAGTTGQWIILIGDGGSFINSTSPNAQFIGVEGEEYLLQWNVSNPNGSGSFDQLNISIADNIMTSVADAGKDSLAIPLMTINLYANDPQMDSEGRWTIIAGDGGLLTDPTDPNTSFTGSQGESYTLRWQHSNECSTSSDEINLTFLESASGVASANGRYFIPDPLFRSYLQTIYPDVMDGDSLIIAMGTTITRIDFTQNASNLDGIQFMTELQFLKLRGDYVSIPFLSEDLTYLECRCTELKVIPGFPTTIDSLYISGSGSFTDSISLPPLPPFLTYLRLDDINNRETINLPETIQTFNSQFAHFEVNKIPENCEVFSWESFGSYDFPELPLNTSNLKYLNLGYNLDSIPSLCTFTNLTELSIYGTYSKLPALPIGLEEIQFSNTIFCVSNIPPGVYSQLKDYPICPDAEVCELTESANSRYYILDERFRQYLQVAYPAVMDGDSLITATANTVEELNLSNLDVRNLDGIRYMISLKRLYLNGNSNLTYLPLLPNTLRDLSCISCPTLSQIENLPESLDSLHLQLCYALRSLPDLPNQMDYVHLFRVGEFTGTSTNFCHKLTHNYTIPDSLHYYSLTYQCIDSFPQLPNYRDNLDHLNIQRGGLKEMPSLIDFTHLAVLWLNNNSILTIDSLPNSLNSINVSDNPIICVENKPVGVAASLSEYSICP